MLDERYRLGRVRGRGGMATVYDASDTRLRRPVAVKLFHLGADDTSLARMATEARLLGGLSHPGLLKVFDVAVDSSEPYMVMQLIDGCTLRTMINDGPLRPVVVARLGARLADTLRYVHSRHIVHRDIKPSNVLVDRSGTGYLADFGVAALIGGARLTRSGYCVGTAAYLAPEQVTGDDPRPPVDIYALGLVLLECLTGRVEYAGTEGESAVARLSRQPRMPGSVPLALRDTLAAMTARVPGDRPDAARCVELFEDYLARPNRAAEPATLITPPANPTKVFEAPPEPARRRPLRAAAAGMLLAGLSAGAFMTLGSTSRTSPLEGPQPQPAPVPVVAIVPTSAVNTVVVDSATTPPPPPAAANAVRSGKPAKGKSGHRGGGEG